MKSQHTHFGRIGGGTPKTGSAAASRGTSPAKAKILGVAGKSTTAGTPGKK